jgi:uncharacterized protein
MEQKVSYFEGFLMDIEGTYTLQATTQEVWASLLDLQTLQRTIPGIEELEKLGEDTYAFTIHIKHAPLRGSYSGQVDVIERQYPFSYRVICESEGQPCKLHSEWTIELMAHHEYTVVAYKGTLHLVKAAVLLPIPLVKGTIKVLIQQFFTALADHLHTASRSYAATTGVAYSPSEFNQVNYGRIAISPSVNQPEFFHRVVRQLRLGGNDPLLGEQWVRRLRRIGIVSVLLLLVWIGTRLPRKPATRK